MRLLLRLMFELGMPNPPEMVSTCKVDEKRSQRRWNMAVIVGGRSELGGRGYPFGQTGGTLLGFYPFKELFFVGLKKWWKNKTILKYRLK